MVVLMLGTAAVVAIGAADKKMFSVKIPNERTDGVGWGGGGAVRRFSESVPDY